MTKKVTGHDAGTRQQYALDGLSPKGGARKPMAELERGLKAQFRERRERFAVMSKLFEAMQAPFFESWAKDQRVLEGVEKMRGILARREAKPLALPRFLGSVKPGITSGSIITLKAPPYDQPFTWSQGTPATVQADEQAGTFSLAVSGGGGSTAASAGIGVWFQSLVDNPSTRVAAYTQYDYNWFDSSTGGYVAHNDVSNRLWVWGDAEQDWVVRQPETPSWSDGTGWYEEHSDTNDGTVSNQAFFPASPHSWYMAWLWAAASVDDSTGGLFGFSWAQAQLSVSVPFLVFEQ